MPKINNLMANGSGNTAVADPPSSAAVIPALHPGVQQALANPVANIGPVAERPVGAYVACAHPRANNWGSLQSAGIAEGDFYLDGCGELRKCMPLKYWLFAASAYGTKMDPSGNVVAASDKPELIADQQQLRSVGLDEHFVSLILVDLGTRIVPAKCDWRATKSEGAKVAINALKAAADPTWVSQSDANKVAAAFPHVFGRVTMSATTNRGVVRGGPNKGLAYHAARATATPSTVADMERLAKAMSEPQFADLLNQAWQNYEARVNQIKAALGGSGGNGQR